MTEARPPLEADSPQPGEIFGAPAMDQPLGPMSPSETTLSGRRDADFSRAVLEDLYRYPKKKKWIARLLWLFTGFFGGHRFYLDRTATGLIMMFTGGGAGAWWVVDGFLIKRFVNAYNEDQSRRERDGLPPRSLSFMPPLRGALLPPFPEWAAKRSGRARIVFDALLLFMFGSFLGAVTVQTGNPEPILAVLALIAITLLGARWDALAEIPILNGFDRWNHRLRLFYFVTDPGGPLRLALRPIFGLLVAPFRKRARAEARLYLQLGVFFTILFTVLDVGQSLAGTGRGISVATLGLGALSFTTDMLRTLVAIYLFAAPIGAILTTHLLLERTDKLIWALSAITIVSIVIGLFGGGFAPPMF
ncbi:MAG: TM2 domain-containing protein [Gemmatimonadota bacterium]